jgi:hypothetical protein
MVVFIFRQQTSTNDVLTINQVAADIKAGKVQRIIEDENRLRLIYSDEKEKTSNKEPETTLIEQLINLGVTEAELSPDNVLSKSSFPARGSTSLQQWGISFLSSFWLVFSGLYSDRRKAAITLLFRLVNPAPACSAAINHR